jgi:hypothetical protein
MTYSKSKVDRSGRALAGYLSRQIEVGRVPDVIGDDVLEAIDVIDWWRGEHARPLSRVAVNLRHYVTPYGRPIIAQRLKRLPTIAGKLLREPTMKLSRMGDIGGIRAVVPSQDAAYAVASRLRRNWTITQYRDYVAHPKADGYRALHLINRNKGRLIEVQLRTPKQDQWANLVEIFSRTLAPGLKYGATVEPFSEFFALTAEGMASKEEGHATDPVRLDRIKELGVEMVTLMFERPNEH